MLADDDMVGTAEQRGIERLIGVPVLQQPVDMDAGFVGEDVLTDDCLVERNDPHRGGGDDRRDIDEF